MNTMALGALAILGQIPPGVLFMDAPTVENLRARQQALQAASEGLVAAADEGGRDLTDEELGTVENNRSEVDRISRQITAREAVMASRAGVGRTTAPDAAAMALGGHAGPTSGRTVPAQARREDPRNGFQNFGEFALAVRNAATGVASDNRLTNAAAGTYSSEGVGADGGFAVPPDFRTAIMTRLFDQDSLVGRCDVQVTTSNTYSAPVDETTPWGAGGIKAYWEREAAAVTQSKPQLRDMTLRLHKLAALVPVTEEMLEDAPAIDGYLRSKTPEAMDWALSYALVWGTGAGEPLGIMNANALITQSAESGQTADTIVAANAVKMLSRLPARSRATAVWLVHPDAEPQLPLMTLGQQPVYLPPGGLADAPLGRLLGRPVIPHQVASTVGDLGDIMLVDWSQYLAVRKAAGVNAQTSVHLWFDQGITAYRFIFRLAGQPWWSAPQSPRSGTNTTSPFVTLAAR